MQNRANPPAAGSPMAAGPVDDQAIASSVATTDPDPPPPTGETPPNGDGSLARQRDEAYERMLEAIDALRGAQAEQAAARARVAELEHQVHIYLVENEHLRSNQSASGGERAARRLAGAVRRRLPSG